MRKTVWRAIGVSGAVLMAGGAVLLACGIYIIMEARK